MKLPGILSDRRVQLAAAAGGVLGLVVLARRGGQQAQPAPGYDSTGSDLASAIEAAQAGWSNDLRGFTDQLTNLNNLLGQQPSTGTGAPVGGEVGYDPPTEKRGRRIERPKAVENKPPGTYYPASRPSPVYSRVKR